MANCQEIQQLGNSDPSHVRSYVKDPDKSTCRRPIVGQSAADIDIYPLIPGVSCAMKSIGAALAAVLLLGACSYNGLLGFEVEIRSDTVNLKPVSDEVSEYRSHCLPGKANKYSC